MASLTISETAKAISNLINSKVSSPRQDELEAIIARVAPTTPSGLSSGHLAYRAAVAEVDRHEREHAWEDTPKLDELMEREQAIARQIWAKPAETWADVLALAEIALHNGDDIMESLEAVKPYLDELAFAKLITAVVAVGRRHYG